MKENEGKISVENMKCCLKENIFVYKNRYKLTKNLSKANNFRFKYSFLECNMRSMPKEPVDS